MNSHLNKIALALLLGVTLLGSVTKGDQVLAFSVDSGVSFSNAFQVDVGDTLRVDLFLNEIGPDTTLVDDGIIGFGLDLVYDADLGMISNANANAFFDVVNRDERSATGFEWEYFDSTNGGLSGSSVLIGSMDFTSTLAGATDFTISDRLIGGGLSNASWFTPTAAFIDENIFGAGAANTYSFSITASAIPEPGSAAILGFIAVGCVPLRRRQP